MTTIDDLISSKESSILIHYKFNSVSLRKIEEVMQILTDPKFKVYDYVNLYKIINTHFLSSIKEHASHEMQDYEDIKPCSIESIITKVAEIKAETYRPNNNLSQSMSGFGSRKEDGGICSCFGSDSGSAGKSLVKMNIKDIGRKLFELVLMYEREKRNFDESSIITVLREVQIQYDLTLRNILLRYLFTVASDDDYELSIVSKNAYFIIFKLLQYDTENTQKEIEALVNNSPGIINFELLSDTFFKNVLSVFLSAYNPTGIEVKDDYETAYNVVKIFKMMSESSFQLIQGIVVRYLRFDYGDKTTKITFFDFLLVIVMKMLILSRWERNSSEENEKSAYLFEMFSAIMELLIEVIQGNSSENLYSLVDHEENSIIGNNGSPVELGARNSAIPTNNLMNIQETINTTKSNAQSTKNLRKRVSNSNTRNLTKIVSEQKENNVFYGKLCVLPQFILFIQTILFDDRSDNEMIYKVRKQMFDFYLAFLEDTNCPLQIKQLIIEQINLTKVISSLKNTMKKFYIKRTTVNIEEDSNNSLLGLLNFKFNFNFNKGPGKAKEPQKTVIESAAVKEADKEPVEQSPYNKILTPKNKSSKKQITFNYKANMQQQVKRIPHNADDSHKFIGGGGGDGMLSMDYDKEEAAQQQSLIQNAKNSQGFSFFKKKDTEQVFKSPKVFKYEDELYNYEELCTLYQKTKVNEKMYDYYQEYFYIDTSFNSSIELEFCSLLFRYIKLLEINFNNSELNYFLSKYTADKEKVIKVNYKNKSKIKVQMKPEGLVNTNMTIDLDEHYENLMMLKFFNSITKIVEVERDKMIIKVVFTINPEFSLVTRESKKSFLQSIPRDNTFSKHTYLLNYSIYFVSEIEYFKKRSRNWLTTLGNWIDYNFVIGIVFFCTLLLNIIMLAVIDGTFSIAIWDDSKKVEEDEFPFRRNLLNMSPMKSADEVFGLKMNSFDISSLYSGQNSTDSTFSYDSDFSTADYLFFNKALEQGLYFPELPNNTVFKASEIRKYTMTKARRNLQIGKNYAEYHLPNVTTFGANQTTINDWKPIYGGIGIVMVAFLTTIAVIWTIVKLPLMYNNKKTYLSIVKKIDFEKESDLYKAYILIWGCFFNSNFIKPVLLYNFFAIIGYTAHNGSWAFAFCLLIIVNISETISNVFDALKMRWMNLLSAFIFQLTVMYAYSNITFYYFNELLVTTIDGELYFLCESLVSCMLITFDFGLRRHAGLGEIIPKASFKYERSIYLKKFFLETSYYIIVTVIIMNIVFGILIDTFRELRMNSKEMENKKDNFCLICDSKKEELERNKISFYKHVNYNHDVWNYIQYMIKIMNSSPQDLTSINNYAYQMISLKLIHWFPSNCYELKQNTNTGKDSAENENEGQEKNRLNTEDTDII